MTTMNNDKRSDGLPREQSAVDDVRRVRERFAIEAAGDLRKLVEASNQVLEQYREKLGLKVVKAPQQTTRPSGTHG
jgi:hypothetical protein